MHVYHKILLYKSFNSPIVSTNRAENVLWQEFSKQGIPINFQTLQYLIKN